MKSRIVPTQILTAGGLILQTLGAAAGPYIPGGTTGELPYVDYTSSAIVSWATGIADGGYVQGSNVVAPFNDPTRALGVAQPSNSSDVVSLGRGGTLTLTFSAPIINGPGADFAIFENGFEIPGQGQFSELAYVEVASGDLFVRFPNISLTDLPVGAFGTIDPTDVYGLAGKAPAGQGTAFDLDIFSGAAIDGFDINAIRYVRIVDIIGDGSATDSLGSPIYDPYPTVDSAGFDLDAVAVLNQGTPYPEPEGPDPEEPNPIAASVDVPLPFVTWALGPALMLLGARQRQSGKHGPR